MICHNIYIANVIEVRIRGRFYPDTVYKCTPQTYSLSYHGQYHSSIRFYIIGIIVHCLYCSIMHLTWIVYSVIIWFTSIYFFISFVLACWNSTVKFMIDPCNAKEWGRASHNHTTISDYWVIQYRMSSETVVQNAKYWLHSELRHWSGSASLSWSILWRRSHF